MELLFPVFLENEAAYDQAVMFWKALFTETELEYQAYLNATNVNEIRIRDGNPIFDAFFPTLKKAVRIIQEEPAEGDELEIGAWLDETEIEGLEDQVQELVISLVLTDESLLLTNQMIGKWVIGDVNREKMKAFINELIIPE